MSAIGIVGAGTAGLHLALLLQQRRLEPTLYAERTADEVRAGRLPNTVAHHHHTRACERQRAVHDWDEFGPAYDRRPSRSVAVTTSAPSCRARSR
jgi:2-polyprenyl-6-methoxyphenol hydroxylase-like FAD-dependent oxidoreductase